MRRAAGWLILGLVAAGCSSGGVDLAAGDAPSADGAPTTTMAGLPAGSLAGSALSATPPPTTTDPSTTVPLPPADEVTLSEADEFCARVSIYLITAASMDHATQAELDQLAAAGEDLAATATDLATSADPAVLARLADCVNDLSGHLPT